MDPRRLSDGSSRPFGAVSVDGLLGAGGIPGRLPMLILMLVVWYGAFKRVIGRYTSVLLTTLAILDFNSVVFGQYMCWTVPFIPLCLLDWFDRKEGAEPVAESPSADVSSPYTGENASLEVPAQAEGPR